MKQVENVQSVFYFRQVSDRSEKKEKTENRNRDLVGSVAFCLPDTGNLVGKWKQSDFESDCGYYWQAVSLCISSL